MKRLVGKGTTKVMRMDMATRLNYVAACLSFAFIAAIIFGWI